MDIEKKEESMCDNIVFIGGVWLDSEEEDIINNSKGNVQIAANVFQKNIIKGIEENTKKSLTIISEKFVGAFPNNYKKMHIGRYLFSHNHDNSIDYNVGFLNVPIIKHYFKYWNSKKYIHGICENLSGEIYVIGYSMTYSVIKSLLYFKKVNPEAKTCLIIPDLPEYMNLGNSRGKVFEILKHYSNKKVKKLVKEIDSYVVLTKYMYEKLQSSKPYVVMEGIAEDKIKGVKTHTEYSKKRVIVYTGTLDKKYGVCNLVDSFCRLKGDNLRLVICGAGDSEQYIKSMQKKDSRIIFKGVVTNQEARRIQQTSYLLVNPRSSDEEYTRYSFPSKTMEYMMSGRPVLMYKLLGIPDEYDKYLFYVDKTLYDSLKSVLSLPSDELDKKGNAAREYVLAHKNAKVQTGKVIQMLNELKL